MGGKSTTSTQSVQIPPEVLARYNAVNARAEDVASRPFIPYSQDPNAFVAALTPSQRAGMENINAVAGMSQPSFMQGQQMLGAGISQAVPLTYGAMGTGGKYAGQAEQAIGAGQQAIMPEQFSQEAIQPYMSPYMSNVVAAQQALQQQEAAQQRSALAGQSIMAGAFGGDRAGIAQANLARQQSLANQATLANLLQSGYTQGLGAFQQQQGVNLGAAQANRAAQQNAAQQLAALGQQQYAQQLGGGQNLYQMGLGGGQAMAGLGAQSEQQALAAAQAQMAAGQIQQQTDQAAKTAMYNQFLQQQGYPYQQAQFLGNIAMGTGALSGSTTTATQPSGWSDRRLKENIKKIGETFDGKTIYRYNLKGDPRTQIGLMAQEVEKDTPEAVGLSRGYKTLDYKKATEGAAKRGHFYQGGIVPSSMGGAVYEPGAFARGGYADGGDIASIYQNKLGRTGSQAEYDYWTGTGMSMDDIANAIANSPEGIQYASTPSRMGLALPSTMEDIYRNKLGRTGSQAEYDYWTGTGMSMNDIANAIGGSPEAQEYQTYQTSQGYPEIEQMYLDYLGRKGTPEEYNYWLNNGMTKDQISQSISNSPEAQKYSSSGQTNANTNTTQQNTTSGGTGQVAGGFEQRTDEDGSIYYYNPSTEQRMSRNEYYNTFGDNYGDASQNEQTISGFYKSLLGRTGTPEEYAYWDKQLQNGMSIDSLRNAISSSAEGVKYQQSQQTATGLNPSKTTNTGATSDSTSNAATSTGTKTGTNTSTGTNTASNTGTGAWYGSSGNTGPLMATGIKAYPYQPALVYNQNAFVQSPYLARNAYGFYAAPQGSSYSSFANPMGQQQATGKGPSSMGGGYGYQPQAFSQPSYGYTPQATGKGPSSYGYSPAPSYGATGGGMPQATGKGSSSGGGGGWASGGRVAKAGGGDIGALLAQLAAQHMSQYGQMAGAPGTEPMSRIKHTLQKTEIPKHLIPGSFPQRPQSGARSAMEMGKGLADLYKGGKEIKADLTKLLAEDKKPDTGTQGGTTTTTTSPAGGAAPAKPNAQSAGLVPEDANRSMTASVSEGASGTFDPFGRGASYNPKDVLDVASLENVGDSLSDWGDSLLLNRGGRAHRAFGGGSGAGRLPSGLAPDGGIDIPDELPGYKLNEQVPKMGGSGGGGGNALGTALTVASTIAKFLPFLPSDRRVKENAEVIGKLHDGQKVYRYDFGDGRTELGLMAQEVEKHNPDAVRSFGGLKMVDYDKATSRAHKYGGGGLGDIVDGVEYRALLERERGLNPLARADDEPVRLAALSPTGTMSDAEPIGLRAGARVAQAATPTPPADVAPDATAPKPAVVAPPAEEAKEEKKPSPIEKAEKIAARASGEDWAKKGPWQQIGEKLSVPSSLQDERVIVPLIAGFGAMLASDKPRFSQALGEGLAGAAGAYGAVRGQSQDIERSQAEVRAIDTATYQKSLLQTPGGNYVWLARGGFMDAGEWDRLNREGNAPPLLGRIPGDAEETIRKHEAAKAAVSTVKPPSAAGTPASSEAPSSATPRTEGETGTPKPEKEPRTPVVFPGVGFSDATKAAAEKERELGLRGGQAFETAKATSQRYNTATDASSNGAREAQRYLSDLALNLSKAAKGKGLDVAGRFYDARAELVGTFNALSRAFGGSEIGQADTIKDINRKIETLQAAAKAAGGNQESFAALERLRGAIANPNMSPRAFSQLAADLMVQNQMALDRAAHKQKYSLSSNGFLSEAGSRFNADNPETKYTKETAALQRLILTDPKLIERLRAGEFTPDQVDQAFKRKFGIDGMSRYFGRGT